MPQTYPPVPDSDLRKKLLGESAVPPTGVDEIALWNSDGDSGTRQTGHLYARVESSGDTGSVGMASTFHFDTGGVAQGNRYTDFAKLYADVVRAKLVAANSSGRFGGLLIICAPSSVVPAGTYSMSGVTIVGLGALTFADGVVFSTLPRAFRRGTPVGVLTFSCTTTSVFTGSTAELVFDGWGSNIVTGGAATVPAFVLTGGTSRARMWNSRFSDTGAQPVVHLGGGSVLICYLYEWSWIVGNPFSDDGLGAETLYVYWLDPNTTGYFGDPHPDDRTFGSTLNYTSVQWSFFEGMGSQHSLPGFLPTHRNQDGFKCIGIHEAMVRRWQFGEVVPDTLTTLATLGVMPQGASYDPLGAILVDAGWAVGVNVGAGTAKGWATATSDVANRQSGVYWAFRWQFQNDTGMRYFHGLTSDHVGAARGGAVGTDTPTGDLIGLQYSTNRADATLQIVTQQSGGVQNLIDTGIAVTGPMDGLFIVDCRSVDRYTEVKILICDSDGFVLFEHTESTAANLPAVGSMLGIVQMGESLDANAKYFGFGMCQWHLGVI